MEVEFVSATSASLGHDRTTLVVEANSGLGNRLRPILSGLRAAHASQRTFRLHWNESIYLTGDEVSAYVETQATRKPYPFPGDWTSYFQHDLPRAEKTLSQTASFVSRNGILPRNHVGSCYMDTWDFIRFDDEPSLDCLRSNRITEEQLRLQKEILNYLFVLTPVMHIKKLIDDFAKYYCVDDDTVGVHIRRHHPKSSKIEIRKFIEAIDNRLRFHNNVLLTTDSEEVEFALKNKYGAHIVCYQKRSRFRDEQVAIEDAIVDLFLLARTGHLILSDGSTFGDLAWWLGRCYATNEYIWS